MSILVIRIKYKIKKPYFMYMKLATKESKELQNLCINGQLF